VIHDATLDQVLQSVAQPATVDRSVLAALLRARPGPETILPLLSARRSSTVQAAILYLGLYGSVRDAPVLALCLQHADAEVAALAEHCLWSIWMQSGTEQGNRTLALAIDYMRDGDNRQAIALLTMLILKEPSFAEAHFQNGLALSSVGRHGEAARAYQQALRLNPHHFAAAAALGHACVELGNLSGALRYYRLALRIYPRLEELPDAVRCLEAALGPERQSS
jgi:tetratricopeptide (TPR) repeat protein